jgi:rhomboid protease GluP
LLAIFGAGDRRLPGIGCAITTRRIYWPGWMSSPSEGQPRRCRWLYHSALPETIALSGFVAPAVALGDGNRIRVAGGQKVRGAFIAFLNTARSLAIGAQPDPGIWESAGLAPGGDGAGSPGDGVGGLSAGRAERTAARWAWPRAVAATREARVRQAAIRAFQGRLLASRGLVTGAIVATCIVVYTLLVIATNQRGPRSFSPDSAVMLEWGAESGPQVLYQGEVWRLLTCMFLHFGPAHLLLNMYCLARVGPLVERLFGHLGFAGLYVVAGLAGSLASLCVHPGVIASGASGAIFGVIGALLGYLALRPGVVPWAKLKPMTVGALAFVGYNLIFAFLSPGIDLAGHAGGLTGGFVCGLLLTGATPARSSGTGRFGAASARRIAVVAACLAVLAASWPTVSEFARGRVLADPKLGPTIAARVAALDDWNEFHAAAEPMIEKMNGARDQIQKLVTESGPGRIPRATVESLRAEANKLWYGIDSIPASNDEIREMKRRLAEARKRQMWMADFADSASGSELYRVNEAYNEAIRSYEDLAAAYFKAHSLGPGPRTP